MSEEYKSQRENTSFPKFIIEKKVNDKTVYLRASEPLFTQWVNAVEERIEALEKKSHDELSSKQLLQKIKDLRW
jgi:vacuolar-type H+-ATPase subunit E/Vma4